MSGNGRLGTTEYAELVGRLRQVVASHVPPGASLLVVSKGDSALLDLPGLAAAHFPQAENGEYAGHHPRDSVAATAHLEELRRRGAEFLVLPDTARWWLGFYGGFAAHLANHAELVADVSGACLIFGLGGSLSVARDQAVVGRPRASVEQLRDYLERLLSPQARLAVLDEKGAVATALAPIQATVLRPEELTIGEPPVKLRRLASAGIQYLLVPRSADEWLDSNAEVAAGIERSCRKVADQRHLCRIFELDEQKDEQ